MFSSTSRLQVKAEPAIGSMFELRAVAFPNHTARGTPDRRQVLSVANCVQLPASTYTQCLLRSFSLEQQCTQVSFT